MTDLKFNILGFLYHAPNRERGEIEIYKQFGANKCVKYAIKELLDNNAPFIKKVIGKNSYALTDDGSRAYESEREIREQKTNQEAQKDAEQATNASNFKKHQKEQFRHDFFLIIISAAVTLLVEHIPKIFNAIISLFK